MFIILTISEDGRSLICEIYYKYHKQMLYTATQILGRARGEEAVQSVFLLLLEKFENNYEVLGDKPGRYFVIITRNHSLNLLKKEHLEFVPLDEELMDNDIFNPTTINLEDTVINGEAVEHLASLIRQLTPSTRQILEYKYIEEYSNTEIADMLKISQSAVSTRINKAKKRLKELLESEVGADRTL